MVSPLTNTFQNVKNSYTVDAIKLFQYNSVFNKIWGLKLT